MNSKKVKNSGTENIFYLEDKVLLRRLIFYFVILFILFLIGIMTSPSLGGFVDLGKWQNIVHYAIALIGIYIFAIRIIVNTVLNLNCKN